MLEETGELDPRVSALDDDLSDVDEEEEDSEDEQVRNGGVVTIAIVNI